MAAPPVLLARTASAGGVYLRLASCPHCAGRRRVLVEVAGEVRGHCLGCGADLPVPLGTEHHHHHEHIVGRGGQAIVETVPE